MEMTRRQFSALLGAAGGAVAVGAARLARLTASVRRVVVAGPGLFPGKKRRLIPEEVRTPGPWLG